MIGKKRFASLLFLTGALLLGCDKTIETAEKERYYPLESYFTRQASKLTGQRTVVNKVAVQNGKKQAKTIRIKDWKKELELFIQSDINKPAWRGSYAVLNNGDFTIYTAKLPELRTRKIIIRKKGDKISYIVIANAVRNFLYGSRERLTWYPDSLYRIEKNQDIRIIGHNRYLIEGRMQK